MPIFTYSGNQAEADRLGDPIIARFTGQACEVVRLLDCSEVDDEVGPMYLVRFGDVYEGEAFEDELDPRPDRGPWEASHNG